MDWSDSLWRIVAIVGARLVGPVVGLFRKITAGPAEVLLRPRHGDELRLVFSSVPRQSDSPVSVPHPEFNYLAGPNEVDFAWTLYPHLRKLVPVRKQLHPIAFSKRMYEGAVEGIDSIPTANTRMWQANLLVSGSTKFNDVTRQLHSEYSQLPVQLVFPQEGGLIIDKRHGKRYRAERRNEEVTADFGILARYWNPYDHDKTIVLIAGCESVFQLGITRTLANRKEGRRFLKALEQRFDGEMPVYFEALIRAPGRGLEFTGPLQVIEAYRLSPN